MNTFPYFFLKKNLRLSFGLIALVFFLMSWFLVGSELSFQLRHTTSFKSRTDLEEQAGEVSGANESGF